MNAMAANMFNPQKMVDRLFRKAENVVWDMVTGRTGYRTKDGIVTLEMEGEDPDVTFQTSINPIDSMGMDIPAFAQQTALDAIKIGDMILTSTSVGWVTGVKPKTISLIRPDGVNTTFTPPKTQMLDFGSGAMVVRSLINTLPGGQAGLGGMSSMLMMMSMMGGSADLDRMIPMMLMMSGAGGVPTAGAAPDAWSAGGMQSMMPMLMMMNMMKSNDSKPSSSYASTPRPAPFNK